MVGALMRRCVSAFKLMRKSVYSSGFWCIRSKFGSLTNEKNIMIRVDERMMMYDVAPRKCLKNSCTNGFRCLLPPLTYALTNELSPLVAGWRVGRLVS